MTVIGCIFAGGRGARLGGRDKALIELSGSPLWSIAADKLRSGVDAVAVLAAERPEWLVPDEDISFVADQGQGQGSIGPAGGLLAAISFAHDKFGNDASVLTVPVDAPFFPSDLPHTLKGAIGDARAAIVESGGRAHPTFGLWRTSALDDVRSCIEHGDLALHVIADRVGAKRASMESGKDLFLNINTPEDLERAEQVWQSLVT